MLQRSLAGRRRYIAALCVFGLAVALGLIAIFRSGDDMPELARVNHDDPITSLLQWLPATDQTERGYAAWVDVSDAPLGVGDALDQLSLSPGPLALGRSSEVRQTIGISLSQVTGWASALGSGATVLAGQFDGDGIDEALAAAGYEQSLWRGVTIWTAPEPSSPMAIEGDDLRALNVVVRKDDHLLLAIDRAAAEAALEAAAGEVASLADRPEAADLLGGGGVAGVMVVDQRDLAVECGVAGPWRTSDFTSASGRTVGVVYRMGPGGEPVTSVWIDIGDELVAEAGLFVFEAGWRYGHVNQEGIGGPITNLASVTEVRRSKTFILADLVRGRDGGWVRSGVRYLIEICEQSSAMVPPGRPDRATPVASPSPEEST